MFFAMACGPGEDVTVVNHSSEVLVLFDDGRPVELIQPAVTEKFFMPASFAGIEKIDVESFNTREVLATSSSTWDEIHREHGITLTVN